MQELFWAFGPFSVKCANVQISSVNSVWRTAACSPVHQLRSTWDQFLGTGLVWNLLLSSRWAVHSAQSAACCWKRVQVYFTQSVLRMRTMIKDGANPHHQHALQPHDRVCVYVCVWGWDSFFFLSYFLCPLMLFLPFIPQKVISDLPWRLFLVINAYVSIYTVRIDNQA